MNPVLVSPHDIEVMSEQTKRAILAHNEKWFSVCGSLKSTVN